MAQPSVILATARYDHTIRLWEAKSGRCYRTIQYPDSVQRMVLCGSEIYGEISELVVLLSLYLCIYGFRTATCQREYGSHAAVNTVVLHPNQKEIISGDQNGNIRVWDLAANSCSCELVLTGPCEHVPEPEKDTAVRSLSVMWDGSIVVAANDHGTCYVWRLLDGTQVGTQLQVINVGFGTVYSHFSVDGAYLMTASSDTTARLWAVSTGEAIRVYQGHHKATVCCALHDGAESAPS
ncbi:hypothetical protein U9M48_010172 [Paspalum notatum var. saurae]|uniref:Target of rapamycin complex subunit LST8 n=1 Tax=Paspalum notatum var. saurae TaxID=547442 RepID=A0AAQ3STI5_PASNO